MDIQKSIVAILDKKKKIIGTGFVAGENLILTCAHVVEIATAGLNEQVTLRFTVDGSCSPLQLCSLFFRRLWGA
jgi:hypothetical protein